MSEPQTSCFKPHTDWMRILYIAYQSPTITKAYFTKNFKIKYYFSQKIQVKVVCKSGRISCQITISVEAMIFHCVCFMYY